LLHFHVTIYSPRIGTFVWLPGGQSLLVTLRVSKKAQLWLTNTDGEQQLLPEDAEIWGCTPDGKKLLLHQGDVMWWATLEAPVES
jgi:hypothetical protein